jgi:TPR repeat protein
MASRLVLVALLFPSLVFLPFVRWSVAQTHEEQPSTVPAEVPTPAPDPAPPQDEHASPELLPHEREDAVILLGLLRGAVRAFPDKAEERLKLAQALYRIGDLDAAIDECRAALKLEPDSAHAHLQLGVTLMAKQDWRAAAAELKEAARLNSDLTQAQYNLGTVYYTTGNLKAAIQSYRQALELQPSFPDARYRLALVLKLTNNDQEAAQLMEEAAVGGVPQAQFFLGNAYRSGQGVEKNLARAIAWWMRAAEFGHQRAAESLSLLRRQALYKDQSDRRSREAREAFRQYREDLWEDFPDLTRNGDSDTLGTTLIKQNRHDDALAVLLHEGYALSDVAQVELFRLYQDGWENHMPRFGKKILTFLETTADEGLVSSKKALAMVYGKGLGVTPDGQKARAMLKGVPKQEAKQILEELSLQP